MFGLLRAGCKVGPLIMKLHGLTGDSLIGGFGGFIILHNQRYMDQGKTINILTTSHAALLSLLFLFIFCGVTKE